MGLSWLRMRAGGLEKATVSLCSRLWKRCLSFLRDLPWEAASISSGMWSALGWSLMALFQLPGQFSTLKQCKIWGVLWPGRQTGCPAAGTLPPPHSSESGVEFDLSLRTGDSRKKKITLILQYHQRLRVEIQKNPHSSGTLHYFLEAEGKAGIKIAFF